MTDGREESKQGIRLLRGFGLVIVAGVDAGDNDKTKAAK